MASNRRGAASQTRNATWVSGCGGVVDDRRTCRRPSKVLRNWSKPSEAFGGCRIRDAGGCGVEKERATGVGTDCGTQGEGGVGRGGVAPFEHALRCAWLTQAKTTVTFRKRESPLTRKADPPKCRVRSGFPQNLLERQLPLDRRILVMVMPIQGAYRDRWKFAGAFPDAVYTGLPILSMPGSLLWPVRRKAEEERCL